MPGLGGRAVNPLPRRRGAVLAAGVAAAAVAAFGVGIASDDPAAGGSSADGNDGVDRYEAWVACSRYIVVGDVTAVRKAPTKGRVVLSLTAQDWLKPSHGRAAVDLEVLDPSSHDAPPLHPGQHVLVVVAAENDGYSRTYRGDPLAGARHAIERALPTAPSACPQNRTIRSDA